jgi:uncharacterized membrane protein
VSDGLLRLLAAVAAGGGVALAAYLTRAHFEEASLVCPIGGGSCEEVQSSAYAELVGVPVALLGLLAYSAILALLAWDAPIARLTAATLALTSCLFSVYLLVVQLFVIDAVCVWCLVNDVLVAPALAVLTGLRLRR